MYTSSGNNGILGRVRGTMLCAAVAGVLILGTALPVLAQQSGNDQRIEDLERRLEQLEGEHQGVGPLGGTGNMVVFRGGAAFLSSNRSNEVFTDVFGLNGLNDGGSGYYIGAALDLLLSKDTWGMLPKTSILGEIGVEYKRWDSKNVAQAVPSTCAAAGVSTCNLNLNTKVQLTMLTVSISPKVKFMEGSRFRPWVIPVGLDFHVISPPSNDTTVLDIGAQFAVGADYRIWKALFLGLDGRYHLATSATDTNNDFGTVGGYLGIGF